MSEEIKFNSLDPKRFPGESFEDYKNRRKLTAYVIKQYKKGRLLNGK
jgi:hypothetical protein